MKSSNPSYRAVSINPGANGACQAIADQEGKKYLSNDAPHLPLMDCTQPQGCNCKYAHWDDRRQDDRRALGSGFGIQQYAGDEQREQRDRRKPKS